MSRWRAAYAGLLAVVLVALGGAASAQTAVSQPPASAQTAHPGVATLSIVPAQDPLVVVIGVDNWTWDEVNPDATSQLTRLLRGASLGSNVPRTARDLACPIDGWLAVNTGTRFADPLNGARTDGTRCRTLVNDPIDAGDRIPNAESYLHGAKQQQYAANPGTLAQWLVESGIEARGIGPGAGIALMSEQGQSIAEVVARPDSGDDLYAHVEQTPVETELLVIDLSGYGIDSPDPASARQLRDSHLEATSAALLDLAEERDITLLVASLADGDNGRQLTVAFEQTFGPVMGMSSSPDRLVTFLGSESTRQPDLVQTTDLLPTITARLQSQVAIPPGMIGLPWTWTASDMNLSEAVDSLRDDAVVADAQLTAAVVFHVLHRVLLVLMAIVALGAFAGQARARTRSEASPITDRGRTLLTRTAIVGAVAPAASYLTGLVPWWQTTLVLRWVFFTMLLLAATAVLAVVTVAIEGRRPGPFTAPTVIAIMTLTVIVWDLLGSAHLSMRSPLGSNVLDAGRFFGMNNTAFSLFVVAAVVLSVAWTRACRNDPEFPDRRLSVLGGVVIIGVLAIGIDGAPSIGADLGGIPSMALATVTLVLLVGRWQITWGRILIAGAGAAALGAAIAFGDYLRPAEQRTHLGRFVEQVLNGQLWTILQRKLSTNLVIAVAIIGGLIVVALVMMAGLRWIAQRTGQGSWKDVAAQAKGELVTLLRPMTHARWVLTASAVGLVVASVINDSGLHIALMGGQFLATFVVMWTLGSGQAIARADRHRGQPAAGPADQPVRPAAH